MSKLVCPECDVEMTWHAARVVEPRGDAKQVDAELGGVVLERHECPSCGESGTTYPAPTERE